MKVVIENYDNCKQRRKAKPAMTKCPCCKHGQLIEKDQVWTCDECGRSAKWTDDGDKARESLGELEL